MKKRIYNLTSPIERSAGEGAWYFVGVERNTAQEIKEHFAPQGKGFGSIRVEVTIGETTWNTSLFPDKRSGMYLLPVKAAIRKKEGLYDGDEVDFEIKIC